MSGKRSDSEVSEGRSPFEFAPHDDAQTFKYRGKSVHVFRRLVAGERTDRWYVKFRTNGRQIYRGTGEDKKTKAIEVAKLLVSAAMDERWDALRETKLRKDKPAALIGQIISAYEQRISEFNLTIKPRTIGGYVSALRSVLRRVHGDQIEKLSGNVLTAELAEKFFANHVREAGNDLLLRDSRIRGANSTLRNARAMFAEMRCYRGLEMPDLSGFMKAETMDNPELQNEEISPETMWEIAQAALFLRDQAPQLYLIHLLYRHLGMRNDEIENARLEWIERRSEEVFLANGEKRTIAAFMVIKRRSYWVPKRSIGEVPISEDVLSEIDRLTDGLNPVDHLVRARTLTERASLVDRDHGNFLRPWVQDHGKVSYELRRWAATRVAQRQGEEFAQRFLRHRSKTVAGKHYITRQAPIAPITIADCGLPHTE